eukprot:gene14173-5177_t
MAVHPISMQTQSKPVQRPSTGSRNWTGPRTINVPRDADGYGFTLRYFVVYPPSCVYKGGDDDDDDDQDNCWSDFETNEDVTDEKPEPLDTFFVKNVAPGGAAESAGLCEEAARGNGHRRRSEATARGDGQRRRPEAMARGDGQRGFLR